jgi:hypothetical protein
MNERGADDGGLTDANVDEGDANLEISTSGRHCQYGEEDRQAALEECTFHGMLLSSSGRYLR